MPGTATSGIFRQGWVIACLVVLLVSGLILFALPYGINWGIQEWLGEHGGEDVTIEDVDFNVFTGRASLEGLLLSDGDQPLLKIPRLDVEVDWLPLFSRQVIVRSVTVNGVSMDVRSDREGHLRVGGIDVPAGESEDEVRTGKTWHVGVDHLEIIDMRVLYRSPELELDTQLDELRLGGIKTWVDQPAHLELHGSINDAPVRLDGELPPLSAGAGYRGEVSIKGFDLALLGRLLADSVDRLGGRLSADSRLELLFPPDSAMSIEQDGSLDVVGLDLGLAADRAAIEKLAWQGKASYRGGATAGASAAGGLTLATLDATQAANSLSLGELGWQGDVSWRDGEDGAVTATGGINAANVVYDQQGSAARLARVGRIEGKLALAAAGDVTVDALSAGDIALGRFAGEDADAIVKLGGLQLDQARLAGGDVALGRLDLDGLVADLRRNKQGVWRVNRLLDSLPDSGSRDQAPADDSKGAVSIAGIMVGGDSAIALQDDSVGDGFSTRIAINAAEIGAIDSARPQQDTPVRLNARTGKHSKIEIDGSVRPFAGRVTLSLDGKFSGIALTQLSPYTTDALGYALQSGQLDADTSARIDAGKMDIGNKLVLRGLEIRPVDNASREKLDSQTSVPLNTALGMLRDKNNTIRLDLPVSGDIDNPEFDISDAINQAVGTALKKGSMTYLKYALQPYGALLTVAQLAGEAASRVSLDPVEFSPGETVVPDTAGAYLEKVAGIMQNRPEINIKVCGHAGEADRVALGGPAYASPIAGGRLPDTVLDETAEQQSQAGVATVPAATGVTDERLLEIATARADAVTDLLVTQYAIDAARLVACQPAIDSSAEGKGRVDLLI